MNRGERRRAERAAAKQPLVIAGDNIIARELEGERYEARPRVELDAKVPGVHRWIVTAAWKCNVDTARAAYDAGVPKIMDNENLIEFGIGCWDCEQPLDEGGADSHCPAGDEWRSRRG